MSKRFSFHLASVVAVGLLLATTAMAQNQPVSPRPTAPAPQPEGRPAVQAAPQLDIIPANWLIVDNQNEIAMAQFAQQKAQETEVKKFSQQMIKDHQELLAKLQRFAGQGQPAGAAINPNPDRRDGAGRNEGAAAQPVARDADQNAQPLRPAQPALPGQPAAQNFVRRPAGDLSQQIVGLKRDLGQQCLASTRREMEDKRGDEFDQCFMHHQVMMHMVAVDTMKVFQSHASGELRQVLAEGIESAQQHLDHAKDLAKKLDGDNTTARREKSTETK